jgi:alanyl-tRNA synthetase
MQKGSLVGRNYLRFDFSFNRPLTDFEIWELEELVNREITKDVKVIASLKNMEEAKKQGAIAFFGEKYGSEVRVLEIGKSVELCGGTHAFSTGQIGAFKIVGEASVASGVRRLEAITGEKSLQYMLYAGHSLESIRAQFKLGGAFEDSLSGEKEVDKSLKEISKLQEKLTKQAKEIEGLILKLAMSEKGTHQGNFYFKCVNNIGADTCKEIMNNIKGEAPCTLLFSWNEGKGTLFVSSSTKEINASEIGKSIAVKFAGKGGGSQGFASFGGITENLSPDKFKSLIKESVKEGR